MCFDYVEKMYRKFFGEVLRFLNTSLCGLNLIDSMVDDLQQRNCDFERLKKIKIKKGLKSFKINVKLFYLIFLSVLWNW